MRAYTMSCITIVVISELVLLLVSANPVDRTSSQGRDPYERYERVANQMFAPAGRPWTGRSDNVMHNHLSIRPTRSERGIDGSSMEGGIACAEWRDTTPYDRLIAPHSGPKTCARYQDPLQTNNIGSNPWMRNNGGNTFNRGYVPWNFQTTQNIAPSYNPYQQNGWNTGGNAWNPRPVNNRRYGNRNRFVNRFNVGYGRFPFQ